MKFKINKKETKKIKKWKNQHNCPGILSEFWYGFSETNGIGTSVRVYCEACGGYKDVTDYGSW